MTNLTRAFAIALSVLTLGGLTARAQERPNIVIILEIGRAHV